jgi:hypothetical protein
LSRMCFAYADLGLLVVMYILCSLYLENLFIQKNCKRRTVNTRTNIL